ncbi:glycyl-radical enzyme activating protein [Maribellus maritimus]|uniref:glycyl-radical enzyme activating protein n=1 Tax=Maribellus maritimus TaxID=2870838 RepID=UPI001EECC5E8|nr:glycyl-radical enzyme activating protein [Maribellus maritimus]MCG6187164.1 glycyl-radical enzyme activating protein [Maribellus maritimus]
MIPLIFDVRRYSINDGPGIRITIFMKGCPLRCAWCHNPESQSPKVQKLYTASKCIGAQDCIEVCPENALTLTPEGIITNGEKCTLCGLCADACPTKAIEMSGKIYETNELLKIIEKERVHIDQSGGGVTFSGGEPTMHPEFLIKMLDACGEKGLHRAVDTCGFTKTETLLEAAQRTDLFLFDLKLMDPVQHKKWTGVDNQLILKNLKLLAETGANINIRIPFIKNVNTDENEIKKMAEFISELPGDKPMINLLPYHNIATGKYQKLELDYNAGEMDEPSEQEIQKAIEIFNSFSLEVEVGG